jgi:hypothetical protein
MTTISVSFCVLFVQVSAEFWSALLDENPTAWCVFVEGWVSKKTWGALFEVFAKAGRVLSIPERVAGELPKRTVVPSKRRPHPIREKDRSFCFWFSPPPPPPATAAEAGAGVGAGAGAGAADAADSGGGGGGGAAAAAVTAADATAIVLSETCNGVTRKLTTALEVK